MKLRLRGSSLRLRITRGEVGRLSAGDAVIEELPVGPSPLRYSLVVDEVRDLCARFEGGRLEVRVPRALAHEWLDSERVGIEATQASGAAALHILLEKDFACLKPRTGEDDSDAFPNPDAGATRP